MATARDTDLFISRVQALLNLASDPRTGQAERENAQAKADAIMFKYRIDLAMLSKKEGKISQREVIVREYTAASSEEFVGMCNTMRADIFRHYGCMVNDAWKLTVVGYEDEIRMAEMLWASVFLNFTRTVFPKWETHLPFDSNVFNLKSAGYSWPFICKTGLNHEAGDHLGKLTQKNSGSKLRSAYKREASRRGVEVERQPINFKKWRRSFVEAYSYRLGQRLRDMKARNEAEAGEAGVLALVSEQDRLKQHFYELYPDQHPETRRRRQEEYRAAEKARWNALTPEEQQKELEEEAKAQARWDRQAKREPAYYDNNGWSAGARAADKADLGQEKIGNRAGRELS